MIVDYICVFFFVRNIIGGTGLFYTEKLRKRFPRTSPVWTLRSKRFGPWSLDKGAYGASLRKEKSFGPHSVFQTLKWELFSLHLQTKRNYRLHYVVDAEPQWRSKWYFQPPLWKLFCTFTAGGKVPPAARTSPAGMPAAWSDYLLYDINCIITFNMPLQLSLSLWPERKKIDVIKLLP